MSASIWERFERRQGRWWLVIAVTAGVALSLPSLSIGRLMDDCYTYWANMGSTRFGDVMPSRWDVFRFFDGNEARTKKLMEMGLVSWWTYPKVHGAFWRPVASATHVLDYTLWPNHPALMHVQSILWYAGLIACVWLLYKRFMGPGWAAGAAVVFFAIDESHGMPVGFLAGRNAVLSALFGVLAIYAHDKWRNDRRRAYGVLGPILLALSLLSAEAGIGVCAYLMAYEVTMGYGAWRKRLVALLPYVAVVAVWRTAWSLQGYGVDGVSIYTDPLAHPLFFAWQVVERLPVLLLGQWGPLPAEGLLVLGGGSMLWIAMAGAALMLFLAWAMLPLLRRDPVARFWGLGMLLAAIPACATIPQNRQLMLAGVGAMGLLGQFVTHAWQERAWPHTSGWGSRTVKSLAVVMIIVHGVIAPVGQCGGYLFCNMDIVARLDRFPAMESWTDRQDLIIVNHPIADFGGFMVSRRDMDGTAMPRRTRILAPARSGVTIFRTDSNKLVIRPEDGFAGPALFRDSYHPMSAGETMELSGVTVTVTELNAEGRPAEATFDFGVPLEDTSLQWVCWKDMAFRVFELPAVGQSVTIPGVLSF